MEETLDTGMQILLASLLDATVVACEYNETRKGLPQPEPHEGPEEPPQS